MTGAFPFLASVSGFWGVEIWKDLGPLQSTFHGFLESLKKHTTRILDKQPFRSSEGGFMLQGSDMCDPACSHALKSPNSKTLTSYELPFRVSGLGLRDLGLGFGVGRRYGNAFHSSTPVLSLLHMQIEE